MLMMRLQRIGRRNEAHYKIVVIEKTKGPKSQKYIDILGSYNPKLGQVTLNAEMAKEWLSKGVQPSDTVYNMLVDKGILEGKKKNVLPKKSPTKKKKAPDEPIVKEEKEEKSEPVAEESAPVEEAPAEAPVETPSEEVLEEAAEGTPELPLEEDQS